MFDAERVRQLHALGLAPMRLREHAVAIAGQASPSCDPPEESVVADDFVLRLWLPPAKARPFEGPHARLLTQILKSIGVRPEQILMARQPEDGGAPLLAFGAGAPKEAIRLAALDKLRDPIEKRVAWPVLRSLRRRLRQMHP
ncbi:hypothetical protein OS176_04030 [Xanthomonadaceae bacterium XH05]|nr:hypothetical protein [Xanthomonadaceae bacterium XH05]